MHGDLTETSLTDVCRRLAVGAASGELTVTSAEANGWVSFRDGVIVAAGSPTPPARLGDRLVGAGELGATALDEVLQRQHDTHPPARLGALLVRAELVTEDHVRLVVQEQVLDALFELSRWRFGNYQFRAGEPVRLAEVPVALPVDDALLDVARRRREWAELSVAIPDLAAVPVLQGEPGTTSVGLTGDEFTVLANMDGQRSVRELAEALGYGEFELARIVHGLALIGLAVIELPEDEVGAALDDALSYLDQLADSTVHPDTDTVVEDDTDTVVEHDPDTVVEGPQIVGATGTPAADADVPAVPSSDSEAPAPAEPERATPDRTEPDETASEPDETASEPDKNASEPDKTASEPDETAGELVEAELPPSGVGSVLAELHGLDNDPPAPGPGDADGAADPAPSGADPAAAGADDFFVGREPAPARRDADDVAEFLRELSRLALDDHPSGEAEAPTRQPPRRPPPTRDTPEPRARRRGLFGRS